MVDVLQGAICKSGQFEFGSVIIIIIIILNIYNAIKIQLI